MSGKQFNHDVHGLRGLAALCVMLTHIVVSARTQDFVPAAVAAALPLTDMLRIGVNMLFIISGYMIVPSLMRHNSAASFLRGRTLRIYPTFLCVSLITFAVTWLMHYGWFSGDGDKPFQRLAIALLMLPGMFDFQPLLYQAWALSYTAVFYLLASALFVCRKRGWHMGWFLLIALVPPLLYFYPRAIYFLVGLAAWLLQRRDLKLQAFPAWTGFVGLLLFFGMISYLNGIGEALPQWEFRIGPQDYWNLFGLRDQRYDYNDLNLLAALPALPLFIGVLQGARWCRWLLRSRAMQFAGTVSYSIFLWHVVVFYPLKLVAARVLIGSWQWPDWLAFIAFALAACGVTLAVAWPSYLLIEEKLTAYLQRKLPKPASKKLSEEKIAAL